MSAHENRFNQLKSFERQVRALWNTLPVSVKNNVEVVVEDVYNIKKNDASKVFCILVIPVGYPRNDKRYSSSPSNITVDFSWRVVYPPAPSLRSAAWAMDYHLTELFQVGLGFDFWDTGGSDDFDVWYQVASGVVFSVHDSPAQPIGEGKTVITKIVQAKFHR